MQYHFFDYKYNIIGYTGQHYDSPYRTIYLIACLVLSLALVILLRKVPKEKMKKVLKVFSIFIVLFYLFKTTWESYYDITTGRGFNFYLMPFDTCSILMWASLLAGFGKGVVSEAAESWLITLGFTGGMSNALFLQGLRYYPFWTFGAFYSMIWHFSMIFLSWWLVATLYTKLKLKTILYAFAFHLTFSIVPFILNGIKHYDFMLYETAGGIPFIENLCKPLVQNKEYLKVTIIMVFVYLAITAILTLLFWSIQKIIEHFSQNKKSTIFAQ